MLMLGAPVLILAWATTPPAYERVSIRCATAITKVIAYRQSMAATDAGVDLANYDRALCARSSKVPERTFVSLLRKDPLIREHGGLYAVDPSGEVRLVRDMPCDESPTPSACE